MAAPPLTLDFGRLLLGITDGALLESAPAAALVARGATLLAAPPLQRGGAICDRGPCMHGDCQADCQADRHGDCKAVYSSTAEMGAFLERIHEGGAARLLCEDASVGRQLMAMLLFDKVVLTIVPAFLGAPLDAPLGGCQLPMPQLTNVRTEILGQEVIFTAEPLT